MTRYKTLRSANLARRIEWEGSIDPGLSFYGNELAGEVGELVEAAVDILNGSSNFIALREEMGDVSICVDLIALRLELDIEEIVTVEGPDGRTWNDAMARDHIKDVLLDIAKETGMVSNTIKKRDRTALGMAGAKGSIEDLHYNLRELALHVNRLAAAFGEDLRPAIADKFNLTSEKYGFETRLEY